MINKLLISLTLAGLLAFGCGKDEPKKVAPKAAPAAPVAKKSAAQTEEPEQVDDLPPEVDTPPPDGTFEGKLIGESAAGKVTLVVRAGVMIASAAEVDGDPVVPFELAPAISPDQPEVKLVGRNDQHTLRLDGRFLDGERASGTWQGTLARKKTSGRWYAIRR